MNTAQVKMFETIAILVVFFFLLIFGVSFYTLMQKSSFEKETEKNVQLKSIIIAQKIAYLPEGECAITGIQLDNCFDLHKAKAMQSLFQQDPERQLDYFPIFEYSTIRIHKIYPGQQEDVTLYNVTGNRTRKIPTFYPLVLYNATKHSYDFGVLEVDVYGI
ncbi:hypothetical protein J4410_04120 [Candidatus Woesearchaeota archaeon]|nr:hypothetical protein [Candidatus Woesearchaeota archaeon]